MTQPELDFTCTRKPDSITSGRAAARMIAILSKRCNWTTRKDFLPYFPGLKSETVKRLLRAGRKASHARIISGQRGYILMRDATADEVRASRAELMSMKKELEQEVVWLDKRAHGILCGTEASK